MTVQRNPVIIQKQKISELQKNKDSQVNSDLYSTCAEKMLTMMNDSNRFPKTLTFIELE